MEIKPTWSHAWRIWWSITWRGIVVGIPIFFLSLTCSLIVGDLLLELPSDTYVWSSLTASLLIVIVSMVMPIRLVLGKVFRDFRLELTPYDEAAHEKAMAPGITSIVIDATLKSYNYPYPMEFSFNGIPSYITQDTGTDELKVTTLDGTLVARCFGKTTAEKFAYRIQSELPDDPVIELRTRITTFSFTLNGEEITVKTARKQIIPGINMELKMSTSELKAVGEKIDAAKLSPPMLVAILSRAHAPYRRDTSG